MARPIRRSGNLPTEATSFIGRRSELAELRKKLTAARLVSLVGPGGVGKTRLAIRAATDLARGFRDGAWLVELADVRDSALVSNAVLAALDLRNQTATEPHALLLAYLRDKELLLVVDNCEHLLEAAAWLLTEVIRASPGVRVIATSREPLSVTDEHVLHPGGFVANWTTRELQARILARHQLVQTAYRLSQLRYDPAKLRAVLPDQVRLSRSVSGQDQKATGAVNIVTLHGILT